MADEKSKRSIPKYLQVLLLLFLAAAGLLFYIFNVEQTSPVASVELKLSRKEIRSRSQDYAKKLGFDTTGCVQSTVFGCDESAKTFLEYRLGLKEANRLMKTDLPVWYWSTRFCKPKSHEEFSARLAPDGKVLALEHVVQHERHLPSITHERAKEVAREFVESGIGYSLSEFGLFEDNTVPRAHRTDHSFTWLDSKRVAQQAGVFITVEVSGDKVSRFSRALGEPESWDTAYRGLRSYNEALQSVANVAHWSLLICAFAIVLFGISKRHINLKLALAVSLVVAGFQVASTFNLLPYDFANYDKSEPLSDFWLETIGKALYGGLWQMLETFLVVAAGELLYRKFYPEKVAIANLFSPAALRTFDIRKQILIGYALGGAWLGWNTLYYLVGKNFGFFSPLDWPLESVLSSAVETLGAVNIGVSASVDEEYMYRLVALLMLQKVTKSFWWANVLQAAAWSFGHSNYPQEPPFVRGMELFLPGLVSGWLVRTYGVLPCLIGHYLYDVFLGVFPLLQSSVVAARLPAMVPLLPFALLPLVAFLFPKQTGRDLTNAAVQTIEKVSVPTHSKYSEAHDTALPLRGTTRAMLFAVTVIGIISCLSARYPIVGQTAELRVTRSQAESMGRSYLTQHGVMPSETFVSAVAVNLVSIDELQYVFETSSLAQALQFANVPNEPLAWAVRFFKPGNTTEQWLYIWGPSDFVYPNLAFDNSYTDLCLSEAEAIKVAEAFVSRELPQFGHVKFKACSTRRYNLRTDYGVNFTVPRLKSGEAEYLLGVELCGGTVAKVAGTLDLPDDWQLKKNHLSSGVRRSSQARGALSILLGAAFVVWMIGVYRAAGLQLRGGFVAAAVVAAVLLLQQYNRLPMLLWDYSVEQSLLPYALSQMLESIPMTAFYAAGTLLLAASSFSAMRLLLPHREPFDLFFEPFLEIDQKKRVNLWIDGVLTGYACIVLLNVSFAALDALLLPLAENIQTSSLDSFCALTNTFSPFMVGMTDMLKGGILSVLALPVLAGMYLRFVRTPWRFWILALVSCGLYSVGAADTYQLLFSFSSAFFSILIVWCFARRFIKFNPIGYFVAGGGGYVLNDIRSLNLHAPCVFAGDILLLWLLLSLPLLIALVMLIRVRFFGDARK